MSGRRGQECDGFHCLGHYSEIPGKLRFLRQRCRRSNIIFNHGYSESPTQKIYWQDRSCARAKAVGYCDQCNWAYTALACFRIGISARHLSAASGKFDKAATALKQGDQYLKCLRRETLVFRCKEQDGPVGHSGTSRIRTKPLFPEAWPYFQSLWNLFRNS